MSLCSHVFRTSVNAQKCSVFKGLLDFDENAKVSYFIEKWCSKWCSRTNVEFGWRHRIAEYEMNETHVLADAGMWVLCFWILRKQAIKK